MDRTIFIPDPNDPNLPEYSEWGYNTFGAEYERDYFLVSNKIIPCKILYKNNQLQFSLSGTIRDNKEMTLSFVFPFEPIKDYTDLIKLHNKEIDLTDDECIVKILLDGQETILDILQNGNLYFKRVQLLSIDDVENRVILSGYFCFNFIKNEFPSFICNGRFDLGITDKLVFIQ
jgi:hypothetical protein